MKRRRQIFNWDVIFGVALEFALAVGFFVLVDWAARAAVQVMAP